MISEKYCDSSSVVIVALPGTVGPYGDTTGFTVGQVVSEEDGCSGAPGSEATAG